MNLRNHSSLHKLFYSLARRIIKNAKLIHKFICYEPERHKNINKFCCDFNKLEKYCRKISKEN
ncbi:hypothetical protein DM473_09915 [Lactobacillus helveticus]|uniref:type III toxin-antitoxin system ToxN/AbiQ family toxin n=1 Tax=Lactobacillus helveticus TaxID=1587 RepID=UPI000C78CFBC|nr:MAG: hypothetical protein DQL94_02225 [Lactobacillus helveticus]MBW7980075.1 hypothetical protein [Lactobacillus helveticus]MBW7999513.1 hypothetical protein [Lactobacillus helveticus]MBW8063430.1 hypothetical protein [Lactobacillus helveticus]MCS8612403.1 hypothetical protein [Lactobacillus helveticus]